MSQDVGFLIGIALAIPLSIAANLLTPVLQKMLEQRSKKLSLKRTKALEEEYIKIISLTKTGELTSYLLMVLVRVALITALFGVVTSAIFTLHNVLAFSNLLFSIGQLTAILGSLVVLRICMSAANDYEKVRNFTNYEEFVLSELPDLKEGKVS